MSGSLAVLCKLFFPVSGYFGLFPCLTQHKLDSPIPYHYRRPHPRLFEGDWLRNNMAGEEGFEPTTYGFGIRRSTAGATRL